MRGRLRSRGVVPVALVAAALAAAAAAANETANPLLGQPEAIAAGKAIYRGRCVLCHGSAGARGPNLFASKISDERFLETVINGRKGTLMPAFGTRMSPDDVWMVHAFVKSTDRY
ncbi:MAG: cytochrome c [Dongiaceae bacterium]